jgi:GAF domain-containing protein
VARLARFVLGEHSLDDLLGIVVDIAKSALPGPPEVSITLVDGRPLTMACSGQLALDVDERQYAAGYGPCLDAVRLGETVIVPDMALETRWPEYLPRAREAGVAASVSIPLPIEDRHIGAMNIYTRHTDVLDDDAIEVARTIGGFAAVALVNADRYQKSTTLADQLEAALQSRAVIDQAKGILIAQHRISADEAFEMLVRLSQNSNRKLRDVAAALVEHAQRPD